MITGVLYHIFEAETYKDSTTRKFWVQELNAKYPMMWELFFSQDFCDELNDFEVGMIVDCDYKIIGRIWEDANKTRKVRTTLNCMAIRKV